MVWWGLPSIVKRGLVHGRPQGLQNGHFPLKIGIECQKFLENLKSATKFQLIDLILAMAVYLPL